MRTGHARGMQGDEMAGINSTGGVALPAAQDLFGGSAASAPSSTTPVPGPVVSGPGGTTALPSAAPTDFESSNPTPLDKPHPQYPALIQSHVAVLQAIGTPEHVIAQLAATQPQAEYLDRYIQGEIMQNPEGWDTFVGNVDVAGNPTGRARAGLQQIAPNVQLPAPGAGTPGYMPDGSPVSGVNVPGLTTPLLGSGGAPPQAAGEGEGLVKGLVLAAAAVGVGLLAWKVVKGGGGSKDAEQLRALTQNGGAAGADGLEKLVAMVSSKGDKVDDLASLQRTLSMQSVVGGGSGLLGGGAGGVATAASLESIMRGHGAANGFINSAGASAVAFNMSMPQALEAALADRAMGVMEQLARNGGTIADLAAARVLTTQLTGGAAQAGQAATKLASLQQTLAGMAHLAV